MSQRKEKEKKYINNKKQKNSLKLFDCFKNCLKSNKKPKDESISEAELILKKHKDLLKFNINTIYKINNTTCNKRHSNSNNFETPQPNKKLTLTPLKLFPKSRKKKTSTVSSFNLNNKSAEYEYSKTNNISFYQTIKFLHPLKDKFACLFCGGKACKHEDYHYNLNNNNAIRGLHSNFITENVIASQRPSEVLIKDYTLLTQFKNLNIGLIINLQREGEHPYCGPNAKHLTQAGFAYNPSVFTGNDIQCKISGWKDMDVPTSMNFMLEIVKEMSEFIENFNSKILVHCHAGYGRTGVVIVCYLLYNTKKDTDTIIKEVRNKRKKCVETKKQVKYCKRFEEFLKHSREIFGKKDSIDMYLKKQENILFGLEQEKYGYIPKLLYKVLEKIQFIKYKNNISNETIYKFILNYELEINEDIENLIEMMKYKINNNDWTLFDNTFNLTIVLELMFVWLEEHVEFVISLERTKKILNNELYIKYFNLFSTDAIKYNREIDLIKKSLLKFIKKVYFFYEYEILYKFALFFSSIPYSTKEEEKMFINCLEKISTGLLGYSSQSNTFNNYFIKHDEINEEESNESSNEIDFNKKDFKIFIKPVIIGLTHIMKIIYEIILQNSNVNGTDLSITADDNLVTPKVRKYGIFSKYSSKFLSNNYSKLNSMNSEIDNDILRRQSWGGMFNKKRIYDSKYSTPNSAFYSHKSYKTLSKFPNEKDLKYYNLYLALDKYYNGNNNNNNNSNSLKNLINKSNTENIFEQLCNPNEIINENKVIENISDISEQMKNNSSFYNENKNNNNENNNKNNENNNKNNENNNNNNENNNSNEDEINTNSNRKKRDSVCELENIITKKYKINNSRTYEKNIGFIFKSKIFKSNSANTNINNKNASRNNLIMEINNEIKEENKKENKNSRNSMKLQNYNLLKIPRENENNKKRKSLFLIKKNN